MPERARFAYAQARLQAHNGRRPKAASWRVLEASKSLGHYLDSARQTGLAPWVTHLSSSADVHAIETTLRRDWRAFVKRVASWLPEDWRAAVLWTATLPDLPLTAHRARGLAPPHWAEGIVDNDNARPARAHAQDWADPQEPLTAWLNAFRARWPDGARDDARELEALINLIGRYLGDGATDSEATREHLRTRLLKTFRHGAQRPVAAFAFLGLMALDVEKLRGDLAKRTLFPERMEG